MNRREFTLRSLAGVAILATAGTALAVAKPNTSSAGTQDPRYASPPGLYADPEIVTSKEELVEVYFITRQVDWSLFYNGRPDLFSRCGYLRLTPEQYARWQPVYDRFQKELEHQREQFKLTGKTGPIGRYAMNESFSDELLLCFYPHYKDHPVNDDHTELVLMYREFQTDESYKPDCVFQIHPVRIIMTPIDV